MKKKCVTLKSECLPIGVVIELLAVVDVKTASGFVVVLVVVIVVVVVVAATVAGTVLVGLVGTVVLGIVVVADTDEFNAAQVLQHVDLRLGMEQSDAVHVGSLSPYSQPVYVQRVYIAAKVVDRSSGE